MFSIYRSSAGSGKTYTLVREYLNIALKYPNAFKNILAITFTNKSTQEMKSRILEQLKNMSIGKFDSMADEIILKYEWDYEELKQRSEKLLENILYNYDLFAVKTIDSFFQDIIRSFAKEIGLSNNFDIETDLNYVIEIIIEKIISKSNNENEDIAKWLMQFAESKLISGKKWDFRKELYALAKETFSEKFITREKQILNYINSDSKDHIKSFLNSLDESISKYENSLKLLGQKAIKKINNSGLEISDFFYGKSGVSGFLLNLSKGIIKPLGSRVKAALDDVTKWYNKTSEKKGIIEKLVNDDLQNILFEIADIQNQNSTKYYNAISAKPLIYALGISSHILNSIKDYRKENETILITDTLIFLNKILGEEDAPFIYEKVGNYYKYFLIDEFQDVSNLQWKNLFPLIENTLSQGGQAMIVGDSKQSIYRWRGGNASLLSSQVEKELQTFDVKNIYLNTNWRSTKEIVDFNNNFFEKGSKLLFNELKTEIDSNTKGTLNTELNDYLKDLFSSYSNFQQKASRNSEKLNWSGIDITKSENDLKTENKLEGCEYIIQKIEALQKSGIECKDIAILVRNNHEIQFISEEINKYKNSLKANSNCNYDITTSSSSSLSNSISVYIIINILKSLIEQDEFLKIELAYIYNFHILSKDIQDLLEIDNESIIDQLPKEFLENKEKLYNMHIYDAVEFIIEAFNLKRDVYIDTFQELVFKLSEKEGNSISHLIEWWELKGNKYRIKNIENTDSINIMTIHQSKGLQFKAIIIPFCNWKLDHSPTNAPVIWSDQNINEYSPPIVPLYYFKSLTNTNYIKDYYLEKINIYFDNLNLVYVAFTRAENELHIKIDPFKDSFNNISDLINNVYERDLFEIIN